MKTKEADEPDQPLEAGEPVSMPRLGRLMELIAQLSDHYEALGLDPRRAERSALADFLPDYPREVALLEGFEQAA
jgi:hypothetical protein